MEVSVVETLRKELIRRIKARVMETILGRELLEILLQDKLTIVFQPIVGRLSRQPFAFEALMRGPLESSFYSPMNILKVATNHDVLFEVDSLARLVALESFAKQQDVVGDALLFLNISVKSVLSGYHQTGITQEALNLLGIETDRVVIEITELEPIEDYSQFYQAVNYYREMGFKVAIDDLGSGYNGLILWSELRPDFVKIDRHFVDGIHLHPEKKRFVETIVSLAKGLNTRLVAEGIEEPGELKVLEGLEVDFYQGYLFKRPHEVMTQSIDYQWPSNNIVYANQQEAKIGDLVHISPTINPKQTVDEVVKLVLNQSKPEFYPVITSEGKVKGMLWRRDFMERLARRFWLELNSRKSIEKVMDKNPLMFDAADSIVNVSKHITDSDNDHKGDAYIVTDNGVYVGCAHFNDLLRTMTDLKMESAQYANPLSGLPGNVPIQNNIRSLLDQNVYFEMIYIDVDHFKPYNDFYSFEQGDDVIRLIARILKSLDLTELEPNDLFFVGHIGGDDFVIVCTQKGSYQKICDYIIEQFEKEILSFYSKEDQKAQGIHGKDREGSDKFYPIMSLSLGVLLVYPDVFDHTQQLASFSTKSKKGAKETEGNSYFVLDTRLEKQVES